MVSSGDLPSDFNLASFFARADFRVFQHNRPLRDLPDWLASRSTWVKLDIWITSKPLDETHKCLSRFSDLKATPSRAGSSVAVRS